MRFPYKLILPILAIVLASLACSLPIQTTPTPIDVENAAQTAVAATLTAMAPAATLAATDMPTGTPAPTETTAAIPTATTAPPAVLRVVFTDRAKNLWAWQEGSAPLKIINSGNVQDVALSDDGQWVSFSRTTSDFSETSLWAIAFDGSNEHQLVSYADFQSMPLHPDLDPAGVVSIFPTMVQFVPLSHTLAFMTAPQFEGPGFFDNKDLWLVDVVTSSRTNLLPAGSGGQYTYNPDGSQIALVTPTDISLIYADGSNRRSSVLTYPSVLTYSEFAYHATPLWAPDSSFLRVSIPYSDSLGDPTQPATLYQLPVDGSPAYILGSLLTAPLNYASYSPDLSKIAYSQQVGSASDNIYSVQIANYDGSASGEVANGNYNFAGWAPDSSHYAYYRWDPRTLYLAQGGVAGVTLVDSSPADNWQWISSERLIFIYRSAPEWQLRLTGLDGTSSLISGLGAGDGYVSFAFAGE
ncbi:MAG: hypothetical protein BGO78_10470 [Chloroflexi bacterium 44-23]|nr:MAG: hypothetical protein BGO78_10470 [Chloroflexi bacterium 44-23]